MKKLFTRYSAIIAVAAVLIIGIIVGKHWEAGKSKKPEISSTAIAEQISELSELSTAELGYRGLIHYSEGEIPFLTKKQFTMIYDAQIKAGVDLSAVKVTVTDNSVTVSLPSAQVQSIHIDPDSLEFYDETFALFNTQERTDTVTALQDAEKDAKEYVQETDLLASADKKAQSLICGFINSIWTNQDELPKITFNIIN